MVKRIGRAVAQEIKGAEGRDGDDEAARGRDQHFADRGREAGRISDAARAEFGEGLDHARDRT